MNGNCSFYLSTLENPESVFVISPCSVLRDANDTWCLACSEPWKGCFLCCWPQHLPLEHAACVFSVGAQEVRGCSDVFEGAESVESLEEKRSGLSSAARSRTESWGMGKEAVQVESSKHVQTSSIRIVILLLLCNA